MEYTYTLSLGDSVNRSLREAAEIMGVEPSEALRRAISLLRLATQADRIELHKGIDVTDINL